MMVAVLGLGSIGQRHARNLLQLGAAVVGFDPDEERTNAAASVGVKVSSSRQDALTCAEAAVVASPSGQHLDDLASALEHGCHVFVEKPFAHTVAGIPELLRRAEQLGLTVFAGLNLRYRPSVQAARKAIAEGLVGEPIWARLCAASYLPDWRPATDHRAGYAADVRTGGVLFDVVHEFDLASHLLGPSEAILAVARQTRLVGIESDDCADVILRHVNGARTALHLDYLTRPALREADVAGTEGRLRLDLLQPRLTVFDGSGAVTRDERWPADSGRDYLAEIESFLACIAGKARPLCDGWEALSVLEQVIAARRLAGLPEAGDNGQRTPAGGTA